jgi:glycosyltransferase involved in cell wall biosynthesis
VPAYNEQASVGEVVQSLHRHAPEFDIVVVDDGSTDATASCAEAAGATVLRMPFNLGIGGAMQAGYRYAADHGYDFAVQIDGDGQHEPSQIEVLAGVFRADPSVDFVYGSRFAEPSGYPAPLNRRIGIKIFAWLLSRITRQKITDPTSGFRLANRRAIALFAGDYPHDYPEVEAILMVHAHRLRVVEVPVRMHARASGRSSITWFRSGYYMVKVLLAVGIGLFRARPSIAAGDPAAVSADTAL